MSLSILDVIDESVYPETIPNTTPVVIICGDSCSVPESLYSKFVIVKDIEAASRLNHNSILKVTNEVQRGFIFASLFSKDSKIKIYTQRPEVINKYLPGCSLLSIKSPAIAVNMFQPMPNVSESISSRSNPSSGSSRKSQSVYEHIYQESLQKYVETVIRTGIRAVKQKSARAQIKNLIDGVFASLRKKGQFSCDFDSDDFVEAILKDLEFYNVITIEASNMEYNDELIEAYFGRRKTREFVPGFKRGPGAREEVKKSEEQKPSNDNLEKSMIDSIISNLISDPRITVSQNIGNVLLVCEEHIKNYIKDKNIKSPPNFLDSVSSKLMKVLLESYFKVISDAPLDKIASNPHDYFKVNIKYLG